MRYDVIANQQKMRLAMAVEKFRNEFFWWGVDCESFGDSIGGNKGEIKSLSTLWKNLRKGISFSQKRLVHRLS